MDTCLLWNPLTRGGIHLHTSIVLSPRQWSEGDLSLRLSRTGLLCTNFTVIYKIKSICPPVYSEGFVEWHFCLKHYHLLLLGFYCVSQFMPKSNYRPPRPFPVMSVSDHHSASDWWHWSIYGCRGARGPPSVWLVFSLPQKGHRVCGQAWGRGAFMCRWGSTLTQGSKSLSIPGDN